jgi:threo-3-hydroxy-L-aspartate ammonia-lyase
VGADPRRRARAVRRGQAEGLIVGTGASEVSVERVRDAHDRLAGVARRTPVLSSSTFDRRVGAEVLLKCENFQRGGAFKFRGAYNTISRLSTVERERGVVAYSSGNHAQAVALASSLLDARAVLVMPSDAPRSKLDATRGYGGEVVTYDRYREDRAAIARAIAAERGLTLIPPYDHPDVIAGQGTVALELLEEAAPLGAIVVPVGGGGLLAGCATVARAEGEGLSVIGVEPEEGDDTRRSLAAGERVSVPVPRTIADGQAVSIPGELTFEINRRLVSEVAVVTDEEILAAMRFLFERMKLVVEPSGATAAAAVLAGRLDLEGKRVGVVVTGGNIDAGRFAELMS